jgi:peptidoglycan/LPS O-acetylase OafA/YrhL
MTIATANAALFTSLATAVAMTWLARHDTALVRYEVVSVLRAIGTFSFSLYLTHVPIGGRVTNLLERFDVPPAVTIVVSVATSVVAAWLFYLAFERRALTARTGRADRTDPVAAAA